MSESNKRKSNIPAAAWIPLVIGLTFCTGLWLGSKYFSSIRHESMSASDKLATILRYIDQEYVDKIDTDSLFEATIPDLLAKLDPHSSYITAESLQGVNEELDGSFSGIGIQFNTLSDTITVIEVVSGGPSEKVGILAGDRILTIDDSLAIGRNWTNERIIKSLRGEKGTVVKLGILRATSPDLLTFEVTRGDIPVVSVDASYMIEPKTGYIRINKFGRETYSEFLNAMIQLRARGATKYVIDLRGNTGGLMEPAVLMANDFLSAGSPIVSMRGRTTDYMQEPFIADGTGAFQNEGLVVLIDEFTASASEIFAGAIQDNDRGVIVGRRSFGKGLVQRQIELPDMSAMRLTTARYHTPSGRCIQKTYTPGSFESYGMEISDRYVHGENYSADSVRQDTTQVYTTLGGRTVYGGGGIMPDVFVPTDTTGISTYYINVVNAGLLHKFAFSFVDTHRATLNEATNLDELNRLLPSDDALLSEFVNYAKTEGGFPPRWYYINISRRLIVNNLKALIVRDLLGLSSYYESINRTDSEVIRAVEEAVKGLPALKAPANR